MNFWNNTREQVVQGLQTLLGDDWTINWAEPSESNAEQLVTNFNDKSISISEKLVSWFREKRAFHIPLQSDGLINLVNGGILFTPLRDDLTPPLSSLAFSSENLQTQAIQNDTSTLRTPWDRGWLTRRDVPTSKMLGYAAVPPLESKAGFSYLRLVIKENSGSIFAQANILITLDPSNQYLNQGRDGGKMYTWTKKKTGTYLLSFDANDDIYWLPQSIEGNVAELLSASCVTLLGPNIDELTQQAYNQGQSDGRVEERNRVLESAVIINNPAGNSISSGTIKDNIKAGTLVISELSA